MVPLADILIVKLLIPNYPIVHSYTNTKLGNSKFRMPLWVLAGQNPEGAITSDKPI